MQHKSCKRFNIGCTHHAALNHFVRKEPAVRCGQLFTAACVWGRSQDTFHNKILECDFQLQDVHNSVDIMKKPVQSKETLSSRWPRSCSECSALLSVALCLSPLPGIVSIMTLSALAYERYIRVVHAQVVDFPWAWRAIGHIWMYSLAWTGAPLLGWNRYTLEIHQLGCSLDWTSKDPNDASFILLFLLACFFVPVGIMIYCYGNILYTVQMVSCAVFFFCSVVCRVDKLWLSAMNKQNKLHSVVSGGLLGSGKETLKMIDKWAPPQLKKWKLWLIYTPFELLLMKYATEKVLYINI